MSTHATLIDELESAVARKEIGQRANVLQRITDLYVTNSNRLSDEQIVVFGDVMARLLKEIDVAARAAWGQRLAELAIAPPEVVRELALDDSIEVAGPILARFERIGEETLVESALTKSQSHLLAISRRSYLPESVTDVLVERGNQQVAVSTAGNPGAKFSEFGYATLVDRAENDHELAACVWGRTEIPRQHLLNLFAAASRAVQQELQSISPQKANEIEGMIGRARDELQTHSRERSAEYLAARSHVESLHDSGQLSEPEVLAFARAGKFDETTVALSLIGDVPIGLVERAMAHDKCDQFLVLAKAIGLSFDTVKAILSIGTGAREGPGPDLKEAGVSFGKLRPETARKAIAFYRLRERAVLN